MGQRGERRVAARPASSALNRLGAARRVDGRRGVGRARLRRPARSPFASRARDLNLVLAPTPPAPVRFTVQPGRRAARRGRRARRRPTLDEPRMYQLVRARGESARAPARSPSTTRAPAPSSSPSARDDPLRRFAVATTPALASSPQIVGIGVRGSARDRPPRASRSPCSRGQTLAVKVAPCGSAMTVMRAHGARTAARPPCRRARRRAATASASSTPERHAPVRGGAARRRRSEAGDDLLEARRRAHLGHALAHARRAPSRKSP